MILYNFNSTNKISNWKIVDDFVMGGRSNGKFKVEENYGVFFGTVSTKNNGGFTSLQFNFETLNTTKYSKFVLRIKGDGKTYQFRVKDRNEHRHTYIYNFDTTEDWQVIEIPFSDMCARFRGEIIDMLNFEGKYMERISFLIGNKRNESFRLLIDNIELGD